MDDLLWKHIEACGLSSRWNGIFRGLGINTLKDLQKHLHTSQVEEELRLQAEEKEKEALKNLLYSYVLMETANDINSTSPHMDKSKVDESVDTEESRNVDSPVNNCKEKCLLGKLGLATYYPGKISLDTVARNSSFKLNATRDIPWYVLSKLFMLDYRGRDTSVSPALESKLDDISCLKGNGSTDVLEDILAALTVDTSRNTNFVLHPLDVIIATFICSSNLLKQVLCEKVFLCKLAFPLVIPSFLGQGPRILLWPLSTIYLEKLSNSEDCLLVSALKLPTPVISCLRLGEIAQSKSKILNEILNDQSHPTFFHRDCENGMTKRSISNGMVEIAWQLHIPRKGNLEKVNTNKVILNLRGNANESEITTNFLLRASNVVLVFVDFQQCKSNCITEFLETVSECNSSCIIVVTKHPKVQFDSEEKTELRVFLETLQKMNFPRERLIFDFDGPRSKNIKILKEEIAMKLTLSLEGMIPEVVGNVFKEVATYLKISIDEDESDHRRAQEKMNALQQCIEEQKIRRLKTTSLPMQCKPWRKWAHWNKEQHRLKWKGESTVDSYADKVYKEKKEERNKQLTLLCHPTKIFSTFLNDILNLSEIQRVHYLKYLQIYLDDLSRVTLPEQQKKFDIMWNQISHIDDMMGGERQGNSLGEQRKELQNQLNVLEEDLAEASFGLEHFMRELAQAYEAFTAAGNAAHTKLDHTIEDLPRIMAELMKQGFPLELVDGDAAHIPLTWINAVLEQLRVIIGDKKIFVLSVLGIQSSGKSTLLNAMFGLQFAVAAGRCTRGVYAQLLPLPDEYIDNQYEYLLVIDTEGLRASELGEKKLQHDNEIATFVIGIGDVTLVNIKGENVSEIEDVLQIVIHALLKMKLVNKSIKLQPSCFFIHQNVPAPDAAEKLKLGQIKFMETLNNVTKAAGKHEDHPEIARFRQLIEFDYGRNIFYFPDLWKGDPPLAPVNPGYSDSVSKVKEILLKDVIPRREFKVGIQEFSVRLKDLWNGILDQNFVFNFKNSLEIQAYNSLECVLSDLQWDLKNSAMKWLNAKINIIANIEELEESFETSFAGELSNHLEEKLDEVKKKLEGYFEGSYAVVLEQWRSRSFTKLEECYNEISYRSIHSLKHELRLKSIQLQSMTDINKYKLCIMTEAKNWANKVKLEEQGKVLGEEDMISYFKEKWNKLLEKVDCDYYEEREDNIETKVMKVLYDSFHEDQVLVREAIANISFTSGKWLLPRLSSIVEKFVSNSWIHSFGLPKSITGESKKDKVMMIVSDRVLDIQAFLANLGIAMTLDDFHCIMETANEVVREIREVGIFIRNEDKFRICLAICIYEYARDEHYKLDEVKKATAGKIEWQYELDSSFKEFLYSYFHRRKCLVRASVQDMSMKTSALEITNDAIVMEKKVAARSDMMFEAEKRIKEFCSMFESYMNRTKLQSFKEEYVEEIIKKVKTMSIIDEHVKLSKRFMIRLAVHACFVALPVFYEKHKKYKDNLNPRLFLEKEYYETYYEVFRVSISKISDEKALANILTEHLSKAVQFAVDRDLQRELANEARNNVPEVRLKSAFLKAILYRLLEEDDFEEFILYLEQYDTCLRKWVGQFIDEYIFSGSINGNRYKEIVCGKIRSILSRICDDVTKSEVSITGEQFAQGDILLWIKIFHGKISKKIPIQVDDMLGLAEGYQILSLDSFKQILCDFIRKSQGKLENVYGSYPRLCLRNVDGPSVYDIIMDECIGCTERCPFCHSPCTMNSSNHVKEGIKHMAYEHYPRACVGCKDEQSRKLVIANCTSRVASDHSFRSGKTEYKWHAYKKYHEIFPDWKIHGDISVEASPYWKWFLVKYESQLAERYKVNRPDIPESWREITKDMARESLQN